MRQRGSVRQLREMMDKRREIQETIVIKTGEPKIQVLHEQCKWKGKFHFFEGDVNKPTSWKLLCTGKRPAKVGAWAVKEIPDTLYAWLCSRCINKAKKLYPERLKELGIA